MTEKRISVLMAIPRFDGHWRGSAVVTRVLRDAGMEVIYMGQQQPETIISAAIDEDVDVIGLSIYAAGYMRLIKRVMNALGKQEGKDIMVLVGGVIPYPDIPRIKEMGVEEVFPPGSPTDRIVDLLVEFLKKELEPHFEEIYEKDIFPRDLYAKVGEKGFLGQVLSPEYGGKGKLIYDAIVAEELGALCPLVGYIHAVSSYICEYLYSYLSYL